MNITTKFKMDLARRGVTPRLDAVQGDENTRAVQITLYANGTAWEPPEGTTAAVAFKKPDGTGGQYDELPNGEPAYLIADNVITVELVPQVLTVPGRVSLSVGILNDDAVLYSFLLEIDVQANPGLSATSENYFKISGALADSGWTPNMYLGTDADGNVVTVEAPEGTGTGLTDEQAEKLDTITVTEDGYTEISGLRKATAIDVVKEEQTVTVTQTLQGDVTSTSVITLDDNDFPVAIVTDGVECAVSWEGFDDEVLSVWEGGSY